MNSNATLHHSEEAPGAPPDADPVTNLQSYVLGFGFAIVLTLASFGAAVMHWVWAPGLPVLLAVLAIAQMGVHLVFFLHITTGPDNVNNVMALAFGVLIVLLLIGGSLWIMAHLNHNMMPIDQLMRMQR